MKVIYTVLPLILKGGLPDIQWSEGISIFKRSFVERKTIYYLEESEDGGEKSEVMHSHQGISIR